MTNVETNVVVHSASCTPLNQVSRNPTATLVANNATYDAGVPPSTGTSSTQQFHHPTATTIHTNQASAHKNLHLLGSNIESPSFSSHFHLSPIEIHVTPVNIVDYIADNCNINKNQLRIRRLAKKGQDIASLNYITFKIETNGEIGDIISKPNFWPSHISITLDRKEFC